MSKTAAGLGGHKARGTGKVAHLSVAERVARGKAARTEVPREAHGAFTPFDDRPDPIAQLQEQSVSRVPDLVPIRYGRMSASAFAFYRGAAAVMASDLATTPTSGLHVQLCGDAHLSNFGAFGSPERHLVFDINDFDETLPGPWEWDVKRLAASFEIGARQVSFTDKERRSIVLQAVSSYRTSMREFAAMGNMDVWYSRLDLDEQLGLLQGQVDPKRLKALDKSLAKVRTRDSFQVFTKLTDDTSGTPRIVSQPPLIVPLEDLLPEDQRAELHERLEGLLRTYRRTLETDRRYLLEQFRLIEVARKVVGVGSVGTRAWIALLLGRAQEDPLFLQIKEADESVLERFVGRSTYANHGQRVVAGQRLMQAASDIFLGWERIQGLDGNQRDFYVRQLRDWKGSVEVESMRLDGLLLYAKMCGWTLARAHARSGDRIAISAYLGKSDVFDRAIAEFSESYADQNASDFAKLQAAIAEGHVKAEAGV
jgi:uncharacterized protein (DUF2252 family)